MSSENYKKYTVEFTASDIPRLYSDWDWLINQKYLDKPWLMTSFGDLFFEDANGGIYFIDTLEGAIIPFAPSKKDAEAQLEDQAIQKRFLMSDTVEILKERNLLLQKGELYIYVPHPLVAGAVVIDSIQVMSANVVISLCGQLLRQMGPARSNEQ